MARSKGASAKSKSTRRKSRGATYHHGDLRRALIEGSLELIAERGPEAFTLREVARRVGVSHAAPYRHFADRDALLLAVAEMGFAELLARGLAAQEGVEAGGSLALAQARLRSFGEVYLRFAAEHPAHYRVMFGRAISAPTPGLRDAGEGAFALLEVQVRGVLEALARAGEGEAPSDRRVHDLAMAIMAGVHGLAMLALDGMLADVPVGPEGAAALRRSERFATLSSVVLDLIDAGLRARDLD